MPGFKNTPLSTNNTDFPQFKDIGNVDQWGIHTGVLRFELIPIKAGNPGRSGLIDDTQTFFLYPNQSSSGNINFASSPNAKGQIINGNCSNTATAPKRLCNVTIVIPPSYKELYVRMRSIYQPSAVTIQGLGPTDNEIKFSGSQVVIDATGKVQDVLRRIRVNVPVLVGYDLPENAIQTTNSICKKLLVGPGTSTPGDGDPACKPN